MIDYQVDSLFGEIINLILLLFGLGKVKRQANQKRPKVDKGA